MKQLHIFLFCLFCMQVGFAQNNTRLVPFDSLAAKKTEQKFKLYAGFTYSIFNNIPHPDRDIKNTTISAFQTGQCFALFGEAVYKKRFGTELGVRLYTGSKNTFSYKDDSLKYDLHLETQTSYEVYLMEKYYFNKPVKSAFIGFGIAYGDKVDMAKGSVYYKNILQNYISKQPYNGPRGQLNISFLVGKEFTIKKRIVDVRFIYNHPVRFEEKNFLVEPVSSIGYPRIFIQTYYYDNLQLGVSIKI